MELFDTNFVYFGQVLPISGMTQLARECGANGSEVPGLGGKNELRVRYPSGANRYPSTVKDCGAVTSLRLYTTKQ